jgi:uncharacterized protein YfaS (alpha-2-macroglobulin family)
LRTISLLPALLLVLTIAAAPSTQTPLSYGTLKEQAEGSYSEKSFGRSHQLYEEAAKLNLPPGQKRWVEMRLADTAWRTEAANPSADTTALDAARSALEALIRDSGENHDLVWAEANESLGDFWWVSPRGQNPGSAQPFYLAALDWWSGSDELPVARRRYLDIVFRMSDPGLSQPYYRGAPNVGSIPREVLVNATSIAESTEERAHARYLLALSFLNEYRPDSVERGLELLDLVIREGKGSAWYDDALFSAAARLEQGAVVVLDSGDTTFKPDYSKALELYRRLVTEFAAGQSKYYEQAQSQIRSITEPSVGVMVGGTFLPRSEEEVALSWRNVREVELSIVPVDLPTDVRIDAHNFGSWVDSISLEGRPVQRRWTYATNDRGDYAPGNDRIRITPRLEPGAYVIRATGGGHKSSQLLLVSDANIVVHQSGRRSDVLICDAVTGQPIAGAHVRVWQQRRDAGFESREGSSNSDGLVTVTFGSGIGGSTFVAASAAGGRQAWLTTWNYANDVPAAAWHIYAFTDRPAYRPEETVRWKFIARTRENDRWNTPAGQTLHYEIVSPRNETISEGTATLNSFGSFWADLPLTSSMPLGAYTIRFRKTQPDNQSDYVGAAQLFRLEEYKLPEFRVEVSTPEEGGKKKQYRLGETVEATIDASYYFGGPVANAVVEAVVYSRPFNHYWAGWREYAWYFPVDQSYDSGQEVKREMLKTDASGRATIRIETSKDAGDTTFRIEARVTDASRREVSGQGSVRVTRQRYSVSAHPERFILHPQDKVSVDFKTLDANDQPVQVRGTVKVVRRHWEEIWIDPSGRELAGRDLDRARALISIFPPPPSRPGAARWERKIAAYREEEITTTTLTTDAKGDASFSFTAPGEGYYLVRWSSEDRDPGRPVRARDLVSAETTVWVALNATTDLGYLSGGLEIIADRDSFRSGQTATVMIVTPASGRWVLVTTSADGILDTQMLHLDGTVKLVEIPLDDRHTPSFFITASSISNRMMSSAMKQVVVPPVKHFINVEVKPDREQYEPRQEGSVIITTRDVDGKPVPAEVAISVADESVTAIQSDPAGDPRQFFFGAAGNYTLQATASVQMQRYLMLGEEDGKLIDDREREQRMERDDLSKDKRYADGVEHGTVGGAAGGRMRGLDAPAAPAVAQMKSMAVAESISMADGKKEAKQNSSEQGGQMEVHVRSDFSSTAFWQPDVMTGADGSARVQFKYPEALTTWRTTARAVSASTQVGMASATTRTNMPLIVRLQAPRFFVAGDQAEISAVLNNNTDAAMRVKPSIEVEGLTLGGSAAGPELDVPAHGEARASWMISAEHPGKATIRVTGHGGQASDAMEKSFTVYEHGVDKLIAHSGKLRGEDAVVKLDLPHERRNTVVTVQVQPSLAVTMLDALPYLIDYPYGCTEQTTSRFLPAAIVARTLAKNGLDAGAIQRRMFGGIEQEHVAKTHPEGAKDLHLLERMTDASMARLYDFQHSDGGWGWWKGGDSDDFMTAYVVWGFSVAKDGGLRVNDGAIQRAVAWLDRRLVQNESDWQQQSWMLHAIAAWRAAAHEGTANDDERRAFENAWSHRDRLTSYSRALLALAAHDFGDSTRAAVLVRNLEDGVKVDHAPDQSILVRGSGSGAAETMGTAHWGEDRFWWHWYDGPVESTAFALQAMVRIDPGNKLIEPVMNWLVKNRRGAQWNNTRDTAVTLLALNDYLGVSGELKGDVAWELSVNGKVIAAKRLSAADVLGAPVRFTIDPAIVTDSNEIRIRRTGGRADASLYFAAEGRFVSLEEPVKAAGNELFVRRDYFRMAPHPTLLKGVVYERVPLVDNGTVNSGERVEVVVTIETKNDYDYLMFEDLKPAGLEAVSLQSGEPVYASELRSDAVARKFAAGRPPGEKPTETRRPRSADQTSRSAMVYQELRDRKVALFIDHLPQGIWEIRYTLRAEVPGVFHALPLLGQAMYVPEIRANGDEVRMTVADTPR